MPEPQVNEFSRHICALCATRGTDVFRLAAKLRMDPMELLKMINGKVVPIKQVIIQRRAKELNSDVRSAKVWRRRSGRKEKGDAPGRPAHQQYPTNDSDASFSAAAT
jgi:hypothetical protein